LNRLKQQLQRDLQVSQRTRQRRSQLESDRQLAQFQAKLDSILQPLLQDQEANNIRQSTQRAAKADAAMEGKGLDYGSWGVIQNDEYSTEVLVEDSKRTRTSLGSMDATTREQQQQRKDTFDTSSSTTAMSPLQNNRILIIADDSSVRRFTYNKYNVIIPITHPQTQSIFDFIIINYQGSLRQTIDTQIYPILVYRHFFSGGGDIETYSNYAIGWQSGSMRPTILNISVILIDTTAFGGTIGPTDLCTK
jgi:hypothetical protein